MDLINDLGAGVVLVLIIILIAIAAFALGGPSREECDAGLASYSACQQYYTVK